MKSDFSVNLKCDYSCYKWCPRKIELSCCQKDDSIERKEEEETSRVKQSFTDFKTNGIAKDILEDKEESNSKKEFTCTIL